MSATLRCELSSVEAELDALNKWDGSERRCSHKMRFVKDWMGDPTIPNGTVSWSYLECEQCGWIDPDGEKPEPPEDYRRER